MSEIQGEDYLEDLVPDETKEWDGVDESEAEGEEPEGDFQPQEDEPDEGQELDTPEEVTE